jgi:hypothetical protein
VAAPLAAGAGPPADLQPLEANFREAKLSVDSLVHFKPNIPPHLLGNAAATYAPGVNPSDALVLFESDADIIQINFIITSYGIYSQTIIDKMEKTASFMRHMIYSLKIKSERVPVLGPAYSIIVNGYHRLMFLGAQFKNEIKHIFDLVAGVLSLKDLLAARSAAKPPAKKKLTAVMGPIDYNAIFKNFRTEKSKVDSDVYFTPVIPPQKLQGAIAKYAPYVNPSDVLMLYDGTVFGSAEDGFLITPGHLFAHESGSSQPLALAAQDINTVKVKKKSIVVNDYKISLSGADKIQSVMSVYGLVTGLLGWGGYGGPVPGPLAPDSGAPVDLQSLEASFRASKIDGDENYYFWPNIPSDKLNNAIKKYAQDANPSDVLVLYDDTVLGSGEQGFMLTSDCLYVYDYQDEKIACFRRDQIHSIKFAKDHLLINGYFKLAFFASSPEKVDFRFILNLISGVLVLGAVLTAAPLIASQTSQASEAAAAGEDDSHEAAGGEEEADADMDFDTDIDVDGGDLLEDAGSLAWDIFSFFVE